MAPETCGSLDLRGHSTLAAAGALTLKRNEREKWVQITGVAVALRQLRDIMLRRRRIDEARSYVEEGRAIIARFVARDPTNGWAVDSLAAVTALHGDALRLSSSAADRARACPAFAEARKHWDMLKGRNAFPAYSTEAYTSVQSRVAECETGR